MKAAAQPTGERVSDIDLTALITTWECNPNLLGFRDAVLSCLRELQSRRTALPLQGAGEGGEGVDVARDYAPHPDEPVKGGSVISADLLERIRAFFVDHHDVVDGPPGYEHEQRPNLAMSLSNELDEEMGVRP